LVNEFFFNKRLLSRCFTVDAGAGELNLGRLSTSSASCHQATGPSAWSMKFGSLL
jgi:hypothetical protein